MGLGKLNKKLDNAKITSKIQLFFLGDSITAGIGTTGTGSSASGPSPVGTVTYPKQAATRLNNSNFTSVIKGYSGRTARWFIDNKLAETIAQFDFATYDDVYCVVFFGANETNTNGTTQASIYQDLIDLHTSLRNAGAKTIVVPILNSQSGTRLTVNTLRNSVNQLLLLNYKTFANEIARLENQQYIFGDLAVENDTYFTAGDVDGFSRIHPSDAGAGLIAEEVAQAISRLSGYKLAYSSNLPSIIQDNVIRRLVRLDFPFRTGLTVGSNTDTLTPTVTGGTSFGNTGTSNYKIAAGQDGYIQYRVFDATIQFAIIGFRTSYSLNANYNTFAAGIFNNAPNGAVSRMNAVYSTGTATSVGSSIILVAGDYLRLVRVGSTIKAQHSANATNGIVWTDLYTFTGSFSGDLFINVDIRGDGKMIDPKGFNVSLV